MPRANPPRVFRTWGNFMNACTQGVVKGVGLTVGADRVTAMDENGDIRLDLPLQVAFVGLASRHFKSIRRVSRVQVPHEVPARQVDT